MRLLMISGDRQVTLGERGPFHALQREFSRYFERIDVLCPRPAGPVSVRTIFERVHFHPADCGRSKMVAYLVRKGEELLAEHGHALIVSHDYGWFYNGLASAKLSKRTSVPYVSEIHHVPGHPIAADWRERFDRRIARAYIRWATPRAKAFRVVNSGEMPALLKRWGVPEEKIVVLSSLYIDLELFHPAPDGAASFDQDVLFVGRMVANKGLERIVDALAKLEARDQPLTALFVGRGPLAKSTLERVRKRGLAERVRFREWVDTPAELAEIYRKSRVVVCASTCEGGPRFTVEAMASGTPVVSTRVGVMGELLLQGDNGVLVDFDVDSLAQGIGELVGDDARRARLGAQAHLDVQRFEYAKTIRAYAAGLYELAGERLPEPAPRASA